MNNSKIALITGANKGIGLETARQLARDHGFTVLIGARDEKRGQDAAAKLKASGAEAHVVRLDVADGASIAQAARHIEEEFGGLDVLVNNAGIALDREAPSQLDLDTMRRTFETNVFGAVAVTQAMLPMLRKSSAGRIVNLSSTLGSLAQNSDPNWEHADVNLLGYNSSKAALNMVTVTLAKELRGTPIKINAADPGYTATDLNGHQGTRTVEQGAKAAVRLATLPDDGPTGGFFDENGPVAW